MTGFEVIAVLLFGCVLFAAAAGEGDPAPEDGQEGDGAPPAPWPPQYKAGGTPADVLGPDGRTWFPNWTAVGVQGGIPDVEEFARIVSDEVHPITDHRSTEAYRRHAAGVIARRLVERTLL